MNVRRTHLATAPRARSRVAWLLLLLLALVAPFAFANDLLVDSRSVQTNDLLTITVSLEGEFAEVDDVNVPLRNLKRVGDPWVSSEFAWINGQVVRRKVFRIRATPLAAGPAQVGPLVLNAPDGQRDTLAAIVVQVAPDRASGSNDPAVVLREMQASGRDPMFVVAEIEKQSVFTGEPLLVTWWLYNAASLQQWHIVSVPKLEEFWAEERPRSERAERVFVGNTMMQRLPIRRVTLFPLRSGTLRVGGLSIEAAIMRRIRSGPFAMYEGELVESTFTSAPFDVVAKPIPPGPPVDAVGDLALTCQPPVQRNGGPVVVRVALTGVGNLRAATAPRFDGNVAGRVNIEGGEVTVSREERSFGMSRQWRYLIFPAESAAMTLPPLAMRVFDPAAGERRELRCPTSFINAVASRPPVPVSEPPSETGEALRGARWPWIAALLLLGALVAVPRIRRELALRREVQEIVRGATPAEIRERVDARAGAAMHERSDRGDAYRALRSLLDAAERDRDIAADAEAEIARRVREVLLARR
jgi:hypothetical protein